MLRLEFQYSGHLMWRPDSFEKTVMLGKIKGRSRRGHQRMRWLDDITDSMDMIWASSRRWWRTGRPGVLQSMRLQKVGHGWVTEQQQKTYCIDHFVIYTNVVPLKLISYCLSIILQVKDIFKKKNREEETLSSILSFHLQTALRTKQSC